MDGDTIEVVVARRAEDAGGDVAVVELSRTDRLPLPAFQAGAHVDVHLKDGLVRQYSLCGDSLDLSRYRIGVLREPDSRGGSIAIHDSFEPGHVLRIGRPRNLFPLDMSGPSILIAGGIGITPILSMAYDLDRSGIDFSLHYCARNEQRTAFLSELREAVFHSKVSTYFSRDPQPRRFDPKRDIRRHPDAHLYVCGPRSLVDAVEGAAKALGFRDDRVHREFFDAAEPVGGGSFEVELAGSGRTITVAPEVTIVKALSAAGIRIEVSCEQGFCGTCLCNVLEGIPDHRDHFLTEEEKAANDQMALCCSRAKSNRLVLDL